MKHKFGKTVKPLLLLLTLITTTTGCVREQDDLRPGKGAFSLNYTFDDIHTMGVSAQSNERVVNDACLIFYKEADNSYVAHSTAVVNSGVGSFSLTIPDAIIAGDKYRVLVVGNYNHFPAAGQSIDDYIGINAGKNYMQMREVMFSQSPSSARMSTPLPFSGVLLGADAQESLFTGPAADANNLGVSVKFSRAVARFDLRNMATDKLVIEWVKVCNYRDRGYFFHSDAPAGNGVIRGTASSAPTKPYPEGYVSAPVNDGKQSFTSGGLYAYPNIVPYVTQDDKLTTCLMIAGYYQKAGEPINTTTLTYYRANVASNQMSQVLKRNYIYTVVINNVKSEGADSEDGAIAEGDRLLDYAVGDDWEDDSGNTEVDGKGNYLTVSRSNVVLDSPVGESAIIKVAVKPGTTWSVAWLSNLEGAFKAEKIDNTSFRIISNGENNTSFVKNGQLQVTVEGTTLAIEIGVMQLSSLDQMKMLTVDSRTGAFDYTVPGQGGVISFQVLTGGSYAAWNSSASNELNQFIGRLTPTGAHKSDVEVELKPNITGAERRGSLTISRAPADGIPDVVINFIQPKSPYVVSVFPNYSDATQLVVEGFLSTPGAKNAITGIGGPNGLAYTERFWVTLADPANYTFNVTSSFNKNADAYISLNTPTTEVSSYKENAKTKNLLTGGKSGETFYLHIFRTAPGDPIIKGSITVTAIPKSGSGLLEQSFSFNVEIKSSCTIGDSKLGSFTLADRNVGAPTKTLAPIAFNYTNDAIHPDNANNTFKGDYTTWNLTTLNALCTGHGTKNYTGTDATGWIPPTQSHQATMVSRMVYSKERAFAVSDLKTPDNRFIGCFFPLSGSAASSGAVYGSYWSSGSSGNGGYYLSVLPGSSSTSYATAATGYSVRCVK